MKQCITEKLQVTSVFEVTPDGVAKYRPKYAMVKVPCTGCEECKPIFEVIS